MEVNSTFKQRSWIDRSGVAALTMILAFAIILVGTIGMPLVVDAVDIQPHSPGEMGLEIENLRVENLQSPETIVDGAKNLKIVWSPESTPVLENLRIVLGENALIQSSGYTPLWVDNTIVRIPEDEAVLYLHLNEWENFIIQIGNIVIPIVPEENMRIENIKSLEFTIRIENVWVENLRYENQQIRDIVIEGDGVQGNVINSVVYEAEEEILTLSAETKYTATVVIAADEEYRADNPAWRDRTEDTLEDADDYFIEEYGLNFRTIRFEEYHSDDSLSNPIELFWDVLAKVDKKDANIMLAFCGQYQGEIMGGAEFRGDDVLIFPKSIGWPYNESEVIQHELSHLYNAKDHIPGLFDWCIMSYTWGGVTTRGWCGSCHQRMEEYILNCAPLLAWTDEDVYSIGETIEINLKNESDRPLDIGSWWIERWVDGGWKRVYPSIWLAYPSEPRTVEPGEVRHLTWDQKVVMQMIRGTKENIYHLVRDQVLPGEYQIVWEPWDRERDETFGRAMSNFCITGTVLRVEPPSAVLGLGDTQTFRAKIVTYTKTDYVVFTETGVTENHLLPFGKRLLGGMFTETWVTENATWTLSDPTVGRICKGIVIGPYCFVAFYAENAGTTTIKASYHGYSDSSLIIVQPEIVVQVAENVIVVLENQENFVWISPENFEVIYWPENFIAIGSDNENVIYWPENDTI